MPASLAPENVDGHGTWLQNLKEKVVDVIKSCRQDDPSKRMQVRELVRAIFTLEYGSSKDHLIHKLSILLTKSRAY